MDKRLSKLKIDLSQFSSSQHNGDRHARLATDADDIRAQKKQSKAVMRTARMMPQLETGPQKCVVLGPTGLFRNALNAADMAAEVGRRESWLPGRPAGEEEDSPSRILDSAELLEQEESDASG